MKARNKLIGELEHSEAFEAFPEVVGKLSIRDAVAFSNAFEIVRDEHREQAKEQEPLVRRKLGSRLSMDAALMAKDAYSAECELPLGCGWQESNEFRDLCFVDKKSGLKSRLYSRNSNGKKEFMYATAGTRNLNDWVHNLLQLGGMSWQYGKSVKNARKLAKRVDKLGGTLYFTGHSQGGGEAICNAMATGKKAIVFNPAGVSMLTVSFYRISCFGFEVSSLVTNFIVDNDPLNILQDALSRYHIAGLTLPMSKGHRVYIKSNEDAKDSHSIDTVLRSFSEQLTSNM